MSLPWRGVQIFRWGVHFFKKAYVQFVQPSGDSKKHTKHKKKGEDRKSKITETSATKHTNSNPTKTFQNPSGKLYSSTSSPPQFLFQTLELDQKPLQTHEKKKSNQGLPYKNLPKP